MKNNSDKEIYRKALESKYKSIKKEADENSQFAAGLLKDMNEISDAADLGIQAAKYGSPYCDWESAINSVERLETNLGKITTLRDLYGNFQFSVSSSTTSAVRTSAILVSGSVSQFARHVEWENAQKVSADYGRFFEKYQIRDEVKRFMVDFGLGLTEYGGRAIKLFEDGWEMFLMSPPNIETAIGSVIPLRESINHSVDELIKLRPHALKGEKVKRKIVEIGMMLKADSVEMDLFEEMEQKFNPMINMLSGTKERLYSRDIEFELMREGTLFLRQLFSSLDPQKLRKRR